MGISDLNVGEAMNQTFGWVEQSSPLDEVISIMLENRWNEAIVFDNNYRLVGLVTKEHLVRILSEGCSKELPVQNICCKDIITTSSEEPLAKARDVMRRFVVGRLPVLDDENKVVGILTAKDVCNGFSNKLEMLGQHMYAVMENIAEAIQVINCQGIVQFWNYGAEKMFGIKAQDITGKPLKMFLKDDLLLRVVNTLEPIYNHVSELSDGVYVLRNAVPVITPTGEVEGAVCTTLDITPTMNLIDQLDQANTRVRKLERKIGKQDEQVNGAFYTVDPGTQRVLTQAQRVAQTNATVLIQGESGTGKDLMANIIYRNSKRSHQPFIQINCSAIPETLFESEMFGYEAGAFTGGHKSGKKGKFELAHGGTIFLDEIGELPLNMQAKLLRVIQEKKFYRVGGSSTINVDVRIIAATNRDIPELINQGKFREDLYYRLRVVKLEVSPLRERRQDIRGLVDKFIYELADEHEKQVLGIDAKALEMFEAYDWPGNVRQLRNVLESVIILMENDYIDEQALQESGVLESLRNGPEAETVRLHKMGNQCEELSTLGENLDYIMESNERELIERALRNCNYNKAKTASALGIPRSTLYYKMKSLHISG